MSSNERYVENDLPQVSLDRWADALGRLQQAIHLSVVHLNKHYDRRAQRQHHDSLYTGNAGTLLCCYI